MAKNEQFNIEWQYQQYLKRVALNEKMMHPQQRIQLRQTFFGAVGQIIVVLRDEMGKLEEEEGIAVMKYMLDQVADYFLGKKNEQN